PADCRVSRTDAAAGRRARWTRRRGEVARAGEGGRRSGPRAQHLASAADSAGTVRLGRSVAGDPRRRTGGCDETAAPAVKPSRIVPAEAAGRRWPSATDAGGL